MSINKENIEPVQMFSKIGRYISERIVHIDQRKSHSFRKRHILKTACADREQKTEAVNKTALTNRISQKSQQFQPCVGHYQVKYSVIDKNMPRYNFKKSLPHFCHDRYESSQISTVVKDVADKVQKRVRGFQEIDRMTGRQQIKGSIRKNGTNPHESRFEKTYDSNYWLEAKNGVSFDKMIKRNNLLFKSLQFSPDYNPNKQFSKKILATHLIHFQKQLPRGQEFILSKTGLSEQFEEGILPKTKDHTVKFEKMLSRVNQDDLPSYLDKNINNRVAISTLNWKTLKMNCFDHDSCIQTQ